MSMVGRWAWGVLIGVDQLGNTLLGGDPDETISSRLGRLKVHHGGRIPWHHPIARLVDHALEVVDKGHSVDSIEPGTHGVETWPWESNCRCKRCLSERALGLSFVSNKHAVATLYCGQCGYYTGHDISKA